MRRSIKLLLLEALGFVRTNGKVKTRSDQHQSKDGLTTFSRISLNQSALRAKSDLLRTIIALTSSVSKCEGIMTWCGSRSSIMQGRALNMMLKEQMGQIIGK